MAEAPGQISFGDAVRMWIRIGLMSFGGPAGQIATMHRYLVEERKWVSESRFLHALNYCMLLPGPEAQQLATYIGWLLHKTKGGLVAGTLFVLPGAVVMWLLSVLYAGFQDLTFVQAIFYGIKAAVLAVVVEALVRIGKRALKNPVMYALAAGAFIGIFFFEIAFPIIIVAAGLVGFIGANTEFCDMRAAYDALSGEMKAKVDKLVALHVWWHSREKGGFDQVTEAQRQANPPVYHPVVRTVARSNRKSLYLGAPVKSIVGMSDAEGSKLIDELTAHCTQPQFVYSHFWHAGDLVIWDNRCTMHRATPFDDMLYKRDMRRTTVVEYAPNWAAVG